MTKTFCDYCGVEMEGVGNELRAQLWNRETHKALQPAGEVFETEDLCTTCSIILNKAIKSAIKKCKNKKTGE